MNNIDIKQALENILLKTDEESVSMISGEWGIGKTYFWKDFRKHILKDKKDVVYISLFGLNNIQDIKEMIVTELVNYNRDYFKKIIEKTKDITAFGIGIGGILSLYSDDEFEKIIICFDDFERISDKINLQDILGLISFLKEQKKCKIVMIINEKEFSKLSNIDGKKYNEIFSLYKEKIIDNNFKFEPSVEDNLTYANQKITSNFDNKMLLEHFQKQNIKNIRILRQINKQLKNFEFINEQNYDKRVLNEFLNTTISTLLFFIKEGKTIEDFFKEKSKYDVYEMSDEDFEKINFDEWKKNIFINHDESIETIILEYIDTNTTNKEKLIDILKDKNNHLNRYDVQQEIIECWHKLHLNFKYKISDFTNEIKNLFEKNKKDLHYILSIDEFYKFITFSKENGYKFDDEFVEDILKNYIDSYIEKERSISVHEQYKQDFIKDNYPKLLQYWKEKKEEILIEKIDIEDIGVLLNKVTTGWGNKDEFILNNIQPKIFKNYIIKSPAFTKNIVKFLSTHKDETSKFYNAVTNIKIALLSLKEENIDYKYKVEKIIQKTGVVLEKA